MQYHLGAACIGGWQKLWNLGKQMNTQYLENKDVKLCNNDKSK